MRENDFAFIGGSGEGYEFPLENFLPPLPKGVFEAWLFENQLTQHVLVDPISANPILPVILAKNGHRVLAARSNPINWLITEVAGAEDNQSRILSSINKLLISRKGDQVFEDTLKGLYQTTCASCGKEIQADGFVWEKDDELPISRVYTCPHCGDAGERDATAEDFDRLKKLGNLNIHTARALQLVSPEQAYEEESVQNALACFPPRSLYACMLLINRANLLDIEKSERKFLQAALLTVFNDAHALRHWPIRNYRFLQFALPQRYFEKNLYLSLTNAHELWPETDKGIPISYWPNMPDNNGGICFFQARLAEKRNLFEDISNLSILTIFPRPAQTYWTLSAIWTSWLWGKNAVKPIRSALRRRRYDWVWFAKAVSQSVQRIQSTPEKNLRIFGVFPTYTPSLAYGLFSGMQSAGFALSGAAFRDEEEMLQAEWEFLDHSQSKTNHESPIDERIAFSTKNILDPMSFDTLLMHGVIQTWLEYRTKGRIKEIDDEAFSRLNREIKQIAEKPGLLIEAESSGTQIAERFLLYQRDTETSPISERVEKSIYHLLQHVNEISSSSIDRMMCLKYSGHLTPSRELVDVTIDAYTQKVDGQQGMVKLRKNELKQEREKDIQEIKAHILKTGMRLGYMISQKDSFSWINPESQEIEVIFFFTTQADLSETLLSNAEHEDIQRVVIYPGSRSALVYHRLQHDYRLAEALKEGWHLVKYRHIRRLAERELITRDSWRDLLDRDPPMLDAPDQLQIL